jgi:hypothetical protein
MTDPKTSKVLKVRTSKNRYSETETESSFKVLKTVFD